MRPLFFIGSSRDDLREFPEVYVLHAFQKKARHGIATPRQEIRQVIDRLRRAEAHHAVTFEEV